MVAPVVGAAGAAAGRTAAGAAKVAGKAGEATGKASVRAGKAAGKAGLRAGKAASKANASAARNSTRRAVRKVPKGRGATARRGQRSTLAGRPGSSGQAGRRYQALPGRRRRRGVTGRAINMAQRGADLARAGSERGKRTLGATGRGATGTAGLVTGGLTQGRGQATGRGAAATVTRAGAVAATAGMWVGKRSLRAGRAAVRRVIPGRRWVKVAFIASIATVVLIVIVSAAIVRNLSQNAQRAQAAMAAQVTMGAAAWEATQAGTQGCESTGEAGQVGERGGGSGVSPGEGALTVRQVAALADYGLRRAGVPNPSEEEVQIATAIASGESGWDPGEHNPVPPDNSYGLWQINMLGDLGPPRRQQFGLTSNEQLFSPKINAIAMGHISNGGRNWRPWSVYTDGTYRRWMTEVEPVAAEIASMSAGDVDQLVDQVDSRVPPDIAPIDDVPPTSSSPSDPCVDVGLAGDVGDTSLPLDPETYPFDENRYWYVKTHHDYPASDLPIPTGTPVYAVAAGDVTSLHTWSGRCHEAAGWSCGGNDRCGTGVNITDPTGAVWTYCHGTRTHVSIGDEVSAGSLIMHSGNTGNSSGAHLHVGVRVGDQSRCPQYLFAELGEGGTTDIQSLPATGCFHVGAGNEHVSDGL